MNENDTIEDVAIRLGQFAISAIEIVAVESPGPGGTIDPSREIKNPKVGRMYVLWERRPDHTIGNVAVVIAHDPNVGKRVPLLLQKVALEIQHGPVVAALGSIIVECSFRCTAAEARLAALEDRMMILGKAKKS